MLKMVFCLRRRPEFSPAEFQERWRNVHGPLVASHADTLGYLRYSQVETLDSPLNAAIAGPRHAPEPFDGIAEMWWASAEALWSSVATAEGRAAARELLEDERRFIDLASSPIWVAREHLIVGGFQHEPDA